MSSTATPDSVSNPETAPDSPTDWLVEQAAIYFENKEPERALATLEEALAADPSRVDVVLFQGNVLFHLGRLAEASARFRQAAQIAPHDPVTHRSLAASLTEEGYLAEAELSIRTSLSLAPQDVQAMKYLAGLLLRREQFVKAAELHEAVLRQTPTDAEVWLSLGRSSFEMKEFAKAALAYETVLKLQPGHEVAQRNLELVRHVAKATVAATVTVSENGLIQDIAADDEMFTGNRDHYFKVGSSALHCVKSALALVKRKPAEIRSVLDLPCGHGRVLRSLKAAFPEARLTACDLNRRGVDFCAARLGATPVYSQEDVAQIQLPERYDLIWCGSLLTHLANEQCAAFLKLFAALLNPGGLALVSVHGRWAAQNLITGRYKYCLDDEGVAQLLTDYRTDGFAYVNYPGRRGYGISLSSPSYVLSNWASLPDLKLVGYTEKGWDNHQDVICLQKQPAGESLA